MLKIITKRLEIKIRKLSNEVNEYERFRKEAECIYGPYWEDKYDKFVKSNKNVFLEIGKHGSLDKLIESIR